MPAWHLVFYSVLILTTAFALADTAQPVTQRLLCAGLSALFGFWYAYMIIWHDRWWRQTAANADLRHRGHGTDVYFDTACNRRMPRWGIRCAGRLFGMLPIGWAVASLAVLLLELLVARYCT